jgi:hypothetical protein
MDTDGYRKVVFKSDKSPFARYCQDVRRQIIRENPHMTYGELGLVLAQKWNKLSLEEKTKYIRKNDM